MSRKQQQNPLRKIICFERDVHWNLYSKHRDRMGKNHIEDVESRRLAYLPHGISRDGTYVFSGVEAWTVCDGVAFSENANHLMHTFRISQYKSIGYLAYKELFRLCSTLPKGAHRKELEKLVEKEQEYWHDKMGNRRAAGYARNRRKTWDSISTHSA